MFWRKKNPIVVSTYTHIEWDPDKHYKRVVFDIDDTIVLGTSYKEGYKHYVPNHPMIQLVNRLYSKGWEVVIMTGRSHKFEEITVKQLRECNLKYHYLLMGKPPAVAYVDDRGVHYTTKSSMKQIEDIITRMSKGPSKVKTAL